MRAWSAWSAWPGGLLRETLRPGFPSGNTESERMMAHPASPRCGRVHEKVGGVRARVSGESLGGQGGARASGWMLWLPRSPSARRALYRPPPLGDKPPLRTCLREWRSRSDQLGLCQAHPAWPCSCATPLTRLGWAGLGRAGLGGLGWGEVGGCCAALGWAGLGWAGVGWGGLGFAWLGLV